MAPASEKSLNPNGLVILDAGEIQARRPEAQFYVVSQLFWDDSLGAEGMQYFKINGHPYLVFSDNLGAIEQPDRRVGRRHGVRHFHP